MTTIDKLKAAALAATTVPHWYTDTELLMYSVDESSDAHHIAACDPQTILKLIAVVEAAQAFKTGAHLPLALRSLDAALEALDE